MLGAFKKIKNQKGFTIIETVLTTVLLSVGLLGSMQLFFSANTSSLENNFRVTASQLANEKIETIIADKTFRGYDYLVNSNYPFETMSTPDTGFTRQVDIMEVSPTDLSTVETGSGYKKVGVIVRWGTLDYQRLIISSLATAY
jgi:Tfp pilus assembly protein PilV